MTQVFAAAPIGLDIPLASAVPLVAFAVLALAFAVLLRRAARLLATTRREDAYRSSVRSLVERIDTSLGIAVGSVDAVRRHQVAAREIADDLATATSAVEGYADEARRLPQLPGRIDPRARLAAELERAGRAIDTVAHGCGILVDAGGRSTELEAQTAIKRGYLNLIHAREAVRRLAGEVAADVSPPPRPLFWRRDHTM